MIEVSGRPEISRPFALLTRLLLLCFIGLALFAAWGVQQTPITPKVNQKTRSKAGARPSDQNIEIGWAMLRQLPW